MPFNELLPLLLVDDEVGYIESVLIIGVLVIVQPVRVHCEAIDHLAQSIMRLAEPGDGVRPGATTQVRGRGAPLPLGVEDRLEQLLALERVELVREPSSV